MRMDGKCLQIHLDFKIVSKPLVGIELWQGSNDDNTIHGADLVPPWKVYMQTNHPVLNALVPLPRVDPHPFVEQPAQISIECL